jgi:hypothetical protein
MLLRWSAYTSPEDLRYSSLSQVSQKKPAHLKGSLTVKDKRYNKSENEETYSFKPQTPTCVLGYGHNSFTPGKSPAGYTAVWDYSGRPNDLKKSPTSKPEKGTL